MDDLSLHEIQIPQITVDSETEQASSIRENMSRSMENLLTIQSPTTTLSSANHRHCSVPEALDTVGKKPDDDHESVNPKAGGDQRFLSAVKLRPASSKKKKQQQTLALPSRKEMHYDYVRRSIIHQSLRINSLRRQARSTGDVSKVTSPDEFDSDDGGYVIEYQDEEEEGAPTQIQETQSGTSSSYVQLSLSSPAETVEQDSASEAHTSQSSDEADASEQLSPPCSPKPPLFLHEHPSLIGAEAADGSADEGDYEKIIIYEELGASVPDDDAEHHYDTVLQMRDRVTQLVHGKHRKKLKKFIIKRKSNVQVVTGNTVSKNQDSISKAVEESDSDSSEDGTVDSKTIQQVRFSRRSPGPGACALRRVHTYHDFDRSRHCPKRESEGDEILRKSQYDQMMAAMLSDHEMKELQDAGAVKIKKLEEMRAEIEELVKNAPPVPPPVPDHTRPRTPVMSKNKWSSKSLKY